MARGVPEGLPTSITPVDAWSLALRVVGGELVNGGKILIEWLGAGAVPVPEAQAQSRADCCRYGAQGAKCPHNHIGRWGFTETAARAILAYARAKNALGLRVQGERELGTCTLCKCKLRLKVQVPFHHIYDHTTDETFAKFPMWCWLHRELKEHTR
jgi:hypothetical protein